MYELLKWDNLHLFKVFYTNCYLEICNKLLNYCLVKTFPQCCFLNQIEITMDSIKFSNFLTSS